MDKNILREIVLEQNTSNLKNLLLREEFSSVEDFKKNDFIYIIAGIRRCGKSTFLQYIRSQYTKNNYYLNFDDERLINFNVDNFQDLVEIFQELYGVQNTFFFDEIQNISGWERFIRRLYDTGKKVFITGSNASMLSKELGTHLTGRHITVNLYPLNFRDYLKFKKFELGKNDFYTTTRKIQIIKHFKEYLNNGGIYDYLKTENSDYLKSLYENILYRDVLARYNLSNEKTLKDLIHYLVSNISSEISYNKIKAFLNLSNPTTVKEYINYFENSFLVFNLSRFDYSLKKQIYYNKKVYFIDNGLANNISFKFSDDIGKLLENLVFLQFKRKNHEIYFHKEKHECDFVISDRGKIIQAVQVTKSLYDEETKKRELNGLIEACKKYKLKEGLILTQDEEKEQEIDGIKIKTKPLWKWLLE